MEYSFGALEQMAGEAKPLQCFIDPDAPEFTPAGNIPERIRRFCERTGQHVPQTIGEVVRCSDESLAMKYRHAMEEIIACTGDVYKRQMLHRLLLVLTSTRQSKLSQRLRLIRDRH